jgi:hypothetical protein
MKEIYIVTIGLAACLLFVATITRQPEEIWSDDKESFRREWVAREGSLDEFGRHINPDGTLVDQEVTRKEPGDDAA